MCIVKKGNVDGVFQHHTKPNNLLESCLYISGLAGGTIHNFLPFLRWAYAGGRENGCPFWYLVLKGDYKHKSCNRYFDADEMPIGHIYTTKEHLPAITPALETDLLEYIWRN